ncbi:MAG TPA: glycosyltransferase family 4 protein [Actinomycetota bacterium]|jgi:glycosyltransferase involved in cell wall biosynthesis|nr:glycosyltransferase family 4 protein [Actinomycetota bacterium]
MRRACTIIAKNYWAPARVLARSLARHHPDVRLCVLVVDADAETIEAARSEPFDVLQPSDVGVDRRELHRMAAIYDLLELATAIKPWLLRHLIDAGASSAVYLDPDIEIFAHIDGVWDLASQHGIVVTPHSTAPLPLDEGGAAEELTILGSGAYNLGFIAVGRSARTFLDWWAERLKRDALIAKDAAMFVDQRWVDLAPSYFNVHILRGDGWNVAYWNLPMRNLTRAGSVVESNGEPLRFFHYSGFDPEQPDVLSRFESDPPRTWLGEQPVLAELCARYAEQLLLNGHRAYSKLPYGFARSARGLPLDRYARRLYRRELLAAEAGKGPPPPDPFDARGARAYEDWLRAPAAAHRVTRYLRALWDERADLRASFRDLEGPDARFYMDWARTLARFEPNVEAELVALETHKRHELHVPGVNVAGYVRAESGVGEVSRLLTAALDAAEVPNAIVPFDKTSSRQQSTALDGRAGEVTHQTNIVCVNADALGGFVEEVGDAFFAGRRTIGVWQWEVDRFPEWMAASADRLDEIWVSSEHTARAVRERTTKPVFVFQPPIIAPVPAKTARAALGLPEGFVFLFCFDFDSVFERKNPLAVVDAFTRAFAAGSGPQLVIKSVRGDAHPEELDRVRRAAAQRADVHIMDGYMAAGDHAALVAACDAYVSLHRAEGFGLTLAEAMALGKPVVATAYSGNLEFMDDFNSWLVPYELVPIPAGCDPYPTDGRWAEPDVDAAAEMMRRIVDDPQGARERAERAAGDIARLHAPLARAPFIIERLKHIPEPEEIVLARQRPERPWTAVRSADKELTTGPDVESPTSYGFVSRVIRKLVLRVARHYIEHQERVQSSLLEGVQDLERRLRAQTQASRALEAEVRSLRERLEAGESFGRPSRVRAYAGLFGPGARVLTVGREAEDLIVALREQGIDAFALGAAGHITAVLDGMERLGDRSLAGILTVKVIDHLSVDDLRRFLELSRSKLDSGGVLVTESEAEADWAARTTPAPTANRPEALLDLCRSMGFAQAYVLFPSGATATTAAGADQGEFAIVASVVPGSG